MRQFAKCNFRKCEIQVHRIEHRLEYSYSTGRFCHNRDSVKNLNNSISRFLHLKNIYFTNCSYVLKIHAKKNIFTLVYKFKQTRYNKLNNDFKSAFLLNFTQECRRLSRGLKATMFIGLHEVICWLRVSQTLHLFLFTNCCSDGGIGILSGKRYYKLKQQQKWVSFCILKP